MEEQHTRAQNQGRRSGSVDTSAARWGLKHPDEDIEHAPPSSPGESEGIVPNRHSASAEAAAVRWEEKHPDDDG